MLNHRQFACYLTNPSRIKKVTSLLNEFGLESRICNGKAKEIIEILNQKINYDNIESQFKVRREESKDFIKKAIEKE